MTVAPARIWLTEGGHGTQRSSHISAPTISRGIDVARNSRRVPSGTSRPAARTVTVRSGAGSKFRAS